MYPQPPVTSSATTRPIGCRRRSTRWAAPLESDADSDARAMDVESFARCEDAAVSILQVEDQPPHYRDSHSAANRDHALRLAAAEVAAERDELRDVAGGRREAHVALDLGDAAAGHHVRLHVPAGC